MLINLLKRKASSVVADIYLSPLGDDASDGSLSHPIATITRLTELIVSNKTVAFKKGGVYEGNFNIDSLTGLSLISYGIGDLPVLTSKKLLTGNWLQNGNIWSYQDNSFPSEITNVFQNLIPLTLGRYPKETRLYKTTTGVGTLIDNNNHFDDAHWNGCQVVAHSVAWVCETHRVTTYASNTFNLSDSWGYQTNNQASYFIQNHVNCLTAQGEWAYNNTTKILYIYSTTQPTNISIGYGSDILTITDSNNISIDGISFNGSARDNINIRNSHDITVHNCDFNHSGRDVINFARSYNIDILSNTADNTNRNFITIPVYNSATATFNAPSHDINVLNNVSINHGVILGKECLLAAQNESGANYGQTAGMAIDINLVYNALIENNHFKNMRYNGIHYKQSGNMVINQNWVDNYCMWLSDGGGIYANGCIALWTTPYGVSRWDNQITNNILTNGYNAGPKNIQANNAGMIWTNGLYLDDATDDQTVTGNYVDGGWYGSISKGCNIFDGNTFNIQKNPNTTSMAVSLNNTTIDPAKKAIFRNNICVQNTYPAPLYGFMNCANGANSNLEFSSNIYYMPFGNPASSGWFGNGQAWLTFANWKLDDSRVDWNRSGEMLINPSQFSNSAKPQLNFIKVLVNLSNNDLVVNASDLPYSDYIDLSGADFGVSRTIEPYKSLVIVRKEN